MTQAETITPLSLDALRGVAINAMIAKAALLARDPDLNKWNVYEQAKAVIGEYELTPREYEDAIARLTEAMNI
mgnify:FL=1